MSVTPRTMRVGLIAWIVLGCAQAVHAQYDCTGVSESPATTPAAYKIVTGLQTPVFVASPPGDRDRIFIVERPGRIKIHNHGTAQTDASVFLDISSKVSAFGGEMGLLGLAFDPSYATTGYFWVDYTENAGGQVWTVVARYKATPPSSGVADPASELRVLRIGAIEFDHKAGMLMFGADGFLYVATGDGGGVGDDHGICGNGQNRSVLQGKILRLDVRGIDPQSTPPDCGVPGASYRVPKLNPFNDGPSFGSCDEIWAYGLRNPWRPSFDPQNGDLYIGDVGQDCWEEVDWVPGSSHGGENYGWRQMEGNACYAPGSDDCNPIGVLCAGSPPCGDASITRPVLTYGHVPGCAVTGGYVYRGCRMPAFRGTYFYGDNCVGFVRTFRMVNGALTAPADLTDQLFAAGGHFTNMTSFGLDGTGEPYVTEYLGNVWKLAPPVNQLEVSGPRSASPFRVSKATSGISWTWEDLFRSTDVAISEYRVYRRSPGGVYSCVFRSPTPVWPSGGDTARPAPGQLYTYVVTAVDAAGNETKPGTIGTFTCP